MLRQDQKELRNLTNKTSDAAFIGSILMYGNNLQDNEKSKIEGLYACMHVCMNVGMYVRVYVCMYEWMNVGMFVCMYVGMYVCM